jgi:hypothetical protein
MEGVSVGSWGWRGGGGLCQWVRVFGCLGDQWDRGMGGSQGSVGSGVFVSLFVLAVSYIFAGHARAPFSLQLPTSGGNSNAKRFSPRSYTNWLSPRRLHQIPHGKYEGACIGSIR